VVEERLSVSLATMHAVETFRSKSPVDLCRPIGGRTEHYRAIWSGGAEASLVGELGRSSVAASHSASAPQSNGSCVPVSDSRRMFFRSVFGVVGCHRSCLGIRTRTRTIALIAATKTTKTTRRPKTRYACLVSRCGDGWTSTLVIAAWVTRMTIRRPSTIMTGPLPSPRPLVRLGFAIPSAIEAPSGRVRT